MKNPLVKQSRHNPEIFWQLTASDVRLLFGLSVNGHLPDEYRDVIYSGPRGFVKLVILSKTQEMVNQNATRPHRIFAVCPKCSEMIPFGRMHQHVRRKDHENS